jgi:hypothetical protein
MSKRDMDKSKTFFIQFINVFSSKFGLCLCIKIKKNKKTMRIKSIVKKKVNK